MSAPEQSQAHRLCRFPLVAFKAAPCPVLPGRGMASSSLSIVQLAATASRALPHQDRGACEGNGVEKSWASGGATPHRTLR
jgi:hypothetical protein